MFQRYFSLPRSILQLVGAQFLVNLINAAVIIIFNLRLRELGFADYEIAGATSYRFLVILLFALPLGLWIRGRRLKPLMVPAALTIIVSSWLMIDAADQKNLMMVSCYQSIWGLGMMVLNVSSLPFIIRHSSSHNRVEAISLSFATWSLAIVAGGLLVALFKSWQSLSIGDYIWAFDNSNTLRTIIAISSLSTLLLLAIREHEPSAEHKKIRGLDYDWKLIAQTLSPALCIAIGAGLTIPFMSLFFDHVYNFTVEDFAHLSAGAGMGVLVGALFVPVIQRKFGYWIAIILTQSLAVFFLVVLALTELYPSAQIASLCYLLRQPLMNMAGPATSELALNFVGKKNRELISALGATIWSGSWFISHIIFQQLKRMDFPYWQIFLMTAGLYLCGIVLYANLIRCNQRQMEISAAKV